MKPFYNLCIMRKRKSIQNSEDDNFRNFEYT